MDWNSTSPVVSQVTIAIIKIPAPVSVTDSRYGGAILLNPGQFIIRLRLLLTF
jgi:hypothetical protein